MYNTLSEYKNTEINCFLIIIQHDNTDIIDTTIEEPFSAPKTH